MEVVEELLPIYNKLKVKQKKEFVRELRSIKASPISGSLASVIMSVAGYNHRLDEIINKYEKISGTKYQTN